MAVGTTSVASCECRQAGQPITATARCSSTARGVGPSSGGCWGSASGWCWSPTWSRSGCRCSVCPGCPRWTCRWSGMYCPPPMPTPVLAARRLSARHVRSLWTSPTGATTRPTGRRRRCPHRCQRSTSPCPTTSRHPTRCPLVRVGFPPRQRPRRRRHSASPRSRRRRLIPDRSRARGQRLRRRLDRRPRRSPPNPRRRHRL